MKAAAWILLPLLVAALAVWAWRSVPVDGTPTAVLDPTRPRPQGDLFVGPYPEPADLNPFTTQEAVARRYVHRYTHDALMELDPTTGELRPALATSVTRSEDGRRCVFTLRTDVRFADGTPLEIADALFTYRAGTDPELPVGALGQALGLIAGVEALDGQRLQITLRSGTPRAFGIVATGYLVTSADWFGAEIARRARDAGGAPPAGPGAPGFGGWLARVSHPGPGTGPYRLDDGGWRRGTDLTLVQNPHSWQRQARPESWNLAGLRLRFLRDPAAQLVALRNQEIDWMSDADPDARLAADPVLAEHYRALVYDHIHLGHYLVVWNHRRPGLGDARVRRALTQLFDRAAIARDLMGGHARPAVGWFKPGSPELPDDVRPLPFDPAAARALLGEAGFDPARDRPLRLTLTYPAGDDLHRRIVELARPTFARAGVELAVQPVARAAMLAQLRDREFDGLLAVLGSERWVDPYGVFHSSQAERGRNWMGYSDAEADRLLEAGRGATDDAERIAKMRAFGALLHRDQPVTLLVRPRAAVLLHKRFRGVELGALGLVPERWWVEPTDRRW